MLFNACSPAGTTADGADADSVGVASTRSLSLSFSFSFSFLFEKSNAVPVPVPGVLGVLAEPKEAKAPEPRPKADDAPPDGDLVVEGDSAPKGFVLL